MEKLKKHTGYRHEIVDNKPLLIKRSYIGDLIGRVLKIFLNRYRRFFFGSGKWDRTTDLGLIIARLHLSLRF